MSEGAPTYDVAVAGAGPAGAVAACLLARAGLSVLLCDSRLVDSAAPVKPGEALPGAAVRLLRACDLPLPGDSGRHKLIGGNISVWGWPEPVHRDFLNEPDGPGWRLDRAVFEAELVSAALAAGARALPLNLARVAREETRWRLWSRGGAGWRVSFLVDASGRAASLARRLGATRRRDEALVAVVGRARPDPAYRLNRTLVETVPQGWWYAALLPDGAPVFMLHSRPDEAARLLARPEEWRAALADTRHVSAAFPGAVFDAPLSGHDACGAWLEPVYGPGWVACGDAALSFDPAAAQGVLAALHGGVEVARAIPAAMRGDLGPLRAYAARLLEMRRLYRQRLSAHYADEQRWPEAPFWREHGRATA
ncbi:FAD-dependent monooxygenase [Sorangium sp. So ce861]|uniref:FAD-dependent monooxygenase n=1 Tax=Sorangium sp. So ce861 TaxID=3133323 RepID=UPI003F614032